MKKQIRNFKKRGMSNLDILRAREIAKHEVQKMEAESVEKAFLYMLGLSVEAGVVTEEDMLNSIKEFAGIDIRTEWYEAKKKYE